MKTKKQLFVKLLLVALVCILTFSIPSAASAKTVATIGSKKYSSLQAAYKQVKKGQTIKLQSNVTYRKALKLNRNVKCTLDLNKKKLVFKSSQTIFVNKGQVTIKNGTLTTEQSVYVAPKAKLTLKKGKFKTIFVNNGTMTVDGGTVQYIENDGGTLTVKSGKITHGINCLGASSLTVKGGTVTQPAQSYMCGAITVSEGYKKLVISGGKVKGMTAEWPAVMIIDKVSALPQIKEACLSAKSGRKVGFVYEKETEDDWTYAYYE